MARIRKGDDVVVVAGRGKGQRGKVLRVLVDRDRLVVEGVNQIKRHSKPTQAAPHGGIITKDAPLHASNVMLHCPDCSGPVKIARRWVGEGGTHYDNLKEARASFDEGSTVTKPQKIRVCRACGRGI